MAEVEITPTDLRFRFKLNSQLLGAITINNPHDARVAYKIKTTAPRKYVVRPSSGIAEPKSAATVQVIMQAQKEYPPDFANCKDKFMVQTVSLADGEQLEKETFSKEGHKEARLRVILEGPPAPPSPVAEVNEQEAGDDSAAPAAASTRGAADVAGAPATARQQKELSAVSSENATLRAQVASVTRDRDDLRRRLDQAERGGGTGRAAGGTATAVKSGGFSLVHLILIAIIAFLLGHYT